jgi:hypothetical protein
LRAMVCAKAADTQIVTTQAGKAVIRILLSHATPGVSRRKRWKWSIVRQ